MIKGELFSTVNNSNVFANSCTTQKNKFSD